MPAGFLALLLGPFGRYRHGCDPPGRCLPFSFLPLSLDGEPFPLACPSNFFTLSPITQQLSIFEPSLNRVRHTLATQQKYLEPPNMAIEAEGNG